MKRNISRSTRNRRRGVTLVEMLVVVALLVLVMTILVAIFSSATGAITAHRAYTAMEQDLRRVEGQLRLDLDGRNGIGGITAKMDPSTGGANPVDGRGYFTYVENALADVQGEDTDDIIAFTATAPPDQPFTGYVAVPITGKIGQYARIRKTSDTAEIIYFLRNGNLYRRVLLVLSKTDRDSGVGMVGVDANGTMLQGGGYRITKDRAYGFPNSSEVSGLYQMPVSWQGMNDISARPSQFPSAMKNAAGVGYYPSLNDTTYTTPVLASLTYTPLFNSLADLTDRENRAFNPRRGGNYDFRDTTKSGGPYDFPDGTPDDENNDGVYDYHTTLYPQVFTNTNAYGAVALALRPVGYATRLGFPYVYPNGYSRPDPFTLNYGRIHSLDPSLDTTDATLARAPRIFNHSPLDLGDPLGTPTTFQTWWGLPTKKETMSPYWTDPVKRLNDPISMPQPTASSGSLTPMFYSPTWNDKYDPKYDVMSGRDRQQSRGLIVASSLTDENLPLPMSDNGTNNATAFRGTLGLQPYGDGAGSGWIPSGFDGTTWRALVDEDLILTNVRSFDVKALEVVNYEPDPTKTSLPTLPPLTRYVDLGYMNYYSGTPARLNSGVDIDKDGTADYFVVTLKTFAHEGRIPPLTTDLRSDAQWPGLRVNIGDDQTGVSRLRRVWDSWSTSYSRANPADTPIDPTQRPPFMAPRLISYPAPYPAALRGIQIQIRVVDPSNQRIKILTTRHDFTSKLN